MSKATDAIACTSFANAILVQYDAEYKKQRFLTPSVAEKIEIASITCGSNDFYLLTTQGQVWHCGDCFYSSSKKEFRKFNVPPIKHVHSKNKHAYMVTTMGHVWVYGCNGYGQLVKQKHVVYVLGNA